MKKTSKLIRKINRLLKKLNFGRYMHHFGPKKYKFVEHVVALLLKETNKLSFRRVVFLFDLFDMKVPTYSALCKMRKRIPSWIWEKLLQLTSGETVEVAIDATGFSKTNPSFHYVKRMDSTKPVKSFAKFSTLFDIRNKKFCGIAVSERRKHDIMDVRQLMKSVKIKKLYGDSAYDAEWLHEYCFDNEIQTIIKPKKNVRRGFYRRKQMKNYSEEQYHQRSLIESGFSALKRKYGSNVSAKILRNVRAELYCKAIAYNISLTRYRFSTEPNFS